MKHIVYFIGFIIFLPSFAIGGKVEEKKLDRENKTISEGCPIHHSKNGTLMGPNRDCWASSKSAFSLASKTLVAATNECKEIKEHISKSDEELNNLENQCKQMAESTAQQVKTEKLSTIESYQKIKSIHEKQIECRKNIADKISEEIKFYNKEQGLLSENFRSRKGKPGGFIFQYKSVMKNLQGISDCKSSMGQVSAEFNPLIIELKDLDKAMASKKQFLATKKAQNEKLINASNAEKLKMERQIKVLGCAPEDATCSKAVETCSVDNDFCGKGSPNKSIHNTKQNDVKSEASKVLTAQKNPNSPEAKAYMQELKSYAQANNLKVPSNCFKGVFGQCSNYIAAMRQLEASGNMQLWRNYKDSLQTKGVKARAVKFDLSNLSK